MTAPAFILAEADEQLVVAVLHEATFAPRLFPARIAARALGALDREAALERDAVGQQEAELRRRDQQIGRASCRESVCKYVEISEVGVSLKNKNRRIDTTKKKL